MSTLLALALLLGTPSTPADHSFAARMLSGKLAEASPTGPAYQKQLWDRLTDPTAAALKACLASHAPADKTSFTVVADVQPNGTPTAIDVQPVTPVARCLADWFARTTLPPPPKLPDDAVYPIEIDVSIVP
jgi:hypothetical protein